MIRIPQVRVVDEEGAQLGVMPTPQALAMAQERGLDLVEVAPLAAPPVVKFLDFGQYKYELTKREKENKRRQRSVTFKEVRLSPKIGTGDFETKVHRAIEFLEDGDRIKVTVRFRGRELTHPELGRNMLAKFTERIKDHGVAERAPLLEGKSMHLTVASLHKPKEHESQQRAQRGPDGAGDTAPAAEAPPADEPVTAKPAAAEEPVTAKPAAADEPVTAKEAQAATAPAAAKAAAPATRAAADEANGTAAKPVTNGPAANASPAAPTAPAGEAAPKAKAAQAKTSSAAKAAEPQAKTNGPVRPAARSTDTSAPQAPAATGE
jgi:translation initiation factor IF-3